MFSSLKYLRLRHAYVSMDIIAALIVFVHIEYSHFVSMVFIKYIYILLLRFK